MAWEQFKETTGRFKPKISIRANGSIGFNAGVIRKFGFDKQDYILLFYDAENRKIGIRASAENSGEGTLKLNRFGKAAWVSANRFFNFFDISLEKTKRYDPVMDEKQKMVVVQL